MTTIEEIKNCLLDLFKDYTVQTYKIDEDSNVYLIADSLVLYMQKRLFINEYDIEGSLKSPTYFLYVQEITFNQLLKFNKAKFDRDICLNETFWEYHRFRGDLLYDVELEVFDLVSRKLPQLDIISMIENWDGFLYNVIFCKMIDIKGKEEYCVFYTKRKTFEAIQNFARDIIFGNHYDNHFSVGTFNLTIFMRLDEIHELFCEKENLFLNAFYSHKSVRKIKRLEENFLYYSEEHYYKNDLELIEFCREKLLDLNSNHNNYPWTKYIYPKYKWKTEEQLTKLVKKLYKEYGVISQYRPFWLKSSFGGQMSYDIFISKLNIAIEYQGKQHFEVVDFFGGKEAFNRTKVRDNDKKTISDAHGVKLLYINYWDNITEEFVLNKINELINE